MLIETLLRIFFYVIGRCSLSADLSLAAGKMRMYCTKYLLIIINPQKIFISRHNPFKMCQLHIIVHGGDHLPQQRELAKKHFSFMVDLQATTFVPQKLKTQNMFPRPFRS